MSRLCTFILRIVHCEENWENICWPNGLIQYAIPKPSHHIRSISFSLFGLMWRMICCTLNSLLPVLVFPSLPPFICIPSFTIFWHFREVLPLFSVLHFHSNTDSVLSLPISFVAVLLLYYDLFNTLLALPLFFHCAIKLSSVISSFIIFWLAAFPTSTAFTVLVLTGQVNVFVSRSAIVPHVVFNV